MKKKIAVLMAVFMMITSFDMPVFAETRYERSSNIDSSIAEMKAFDEGAAVEETEVSETEEALSTEEVSETEEVLGTEEVSETEKALGTEEVSETEEVLGTEEVSETEEVLGTEEVSETEEVLETEAVSETESDEIEKILMNGLESLEDDPEYVKILAEREELLNTPETQSFDYAGYKHDDRFSGATIHKGIDVSYYQGDINWNNVKNQSGIEFAMVRVGYRGYSKGALTTDSKARQNIQGANAAGIKVGAYFFSQAITTAEAEEEARYALSNISGLNITMPIAIDFEYISNNQGRLYNAHLSREQATAIVNAFCAVIQQAGYTPLVYANKTMLENNLNAGGIPYKVWLANYTTQTSYAGAYEFWQYSSKGSIQGISGNVDCDFWYETGKKTYTQTIEDGIYTIESSLASGLLLDVNGASNANNANVQLWRGNQRFNVKYIGDNKYSIQALCSGKYLDAEKAGTTAGTNVLQYDWGNGDNQKWYIEDRGNGYYSIVSSLSGLYLNVADNSTNNGANVLLWYENGQNNQKFKFNKVTYNRTIEDGIYTIESSLASGLLLDVNGASTANNANVQLWRGNQRFNVTYVGDGKYSIQALCSGKYLDAEKAGTTVGTNVLQYEWGNSNNQKWYIEDRGNGYYSIVSSISGLCLDVANGEAKNGANVLLWNQNGGSNQNFKFNKITYERTIKDGTYYIESGLSDKMKLDISGAVSDNNANAQLWSGNQIFKVKYLENGKYSITAMCSGKMLTADNSGRNNGTNLVQYQENGNESQKWYIQDSGNGYYRIISALNFLSVDVANGEAKNGANVQLWSTNEGNNQKFKFVSTDDTLHDFEDGIYEIESALASGMLLDVNGASQENSANVQLWRGNQRFKLTYLGDGKYSIMAMCSNKVLDAENSGKEEGTNVIQFTSNGGENQKWYIKRNDDGYYHIYSAASMLRMDVYNGEAKNGTNVLLWSANNGKNQKFKLKKVD